jgi:hypothetical protein
VNDVSFDLPPVLRPEIPAGVACVPAGLPGLEELSLPAMGKFSEVAAAVTARRAP